MKKFLIVFFAIVFFITAPAYGWVENGQICYRHGKFNLKSCREPRDAADLQRAIDSDRETSARISSQNKFDSCNFSILNNWSSEVERLKIKIEAEKNILSFANKERYWASEDIRKSGVLPSETVRSAYDSMSTFNGMASEAQRNIALYSWCGQCAMKKPKGYEDCQ